MSEARPKRHHRRPPSAGIGRKRGVPNHITRDVRAAVTEIVVGNAWRVQGWLDRIEKREPEKALTLWERLAEYVLPKLSRSVVSVGIATFEGVPRVVTDPAEAAQAHLRMVRGELAVAAVRFESPALPAPIEAEPEDAP